MSHKYYVAEITHEQFHILQKKILEEKSIHLAHGGFYNKRVCIFVRDDVADIVRKDYNIMLDGPYFCE